MEKSANRYRAGTRRRDSLSLGRVILGAGLLAALILTLTAGRAAALVPPEAGPAVRVAGGFELTGTVNPYGIDTTYHFEYGTTTAYGTSVPMPDGDAGAAAYSAPVSQVITGLEADATYHYRLVSTNAVEGTASSADRTFSTGETTAAPPSTGGGNTPTGPAATTTTESTGGTATVSGKGPKTVAKLVRGGGRSLLATTTGRTLYSLSVETHARFVCTMSSGCLSVWHPLTVAAGVTPKGPVKLGTMERPEGTLQVTYRGRPLYTYAADKKPGQDKGDGLKDAGVWHAVSLPPPQR
jgi:predicted lipoprotein with Yx(FWY)xxD motif